VENSNHLFELIDEFYYVKRHICKDVIKPSLGADKEDLSKFLEFCCIMDSKFVKGGWTGVVLKSYIAFAFLKLRKLPVNQRAKLLPRDFFNGVLADEFKRANANSWMSYRNSAAKITGDDYFYFDIKVKSNFDLMEYEKTCHKKLKRFDICCISNGGFMSSSKACLSCIFEEKYKYSEMFDKKFKELEGE
jgi:hypothetical protein